MRRPTLFQLNTRTTMQELGVALGRPATLDDLPDGMIDGWRDRGFEWLWPLGVWQTGEAARRVSRTNPSLREEFARELPDLCDADIVGSPFAVQSWDVHRDFGGNAALERLRTRLAARGMKLLLDFVPNHVAPDHPWVASHPEYLVQGTDADLAREPHNYVRLATPKGPIVFAYGRDPYFAGWPDTVQLNYRHGGLREDQLRELGRVASRCDAVRCDMAMLLQPDVFQRTWGDKARPADGSHPVDRPFWPEAIAAIKRRHPGFLFVAEVYWDLEWDLQQAGFDFTYDKRLYDRLHAGDARAVRGHLHADAAFQERSLRFLENHDEPRASATFDGGKHRAAATITYLVPGLRLFHDGQAEGRRVHTSMHLGRRPAEPVDPAIAAFYARLLAVIRRPEAHEGHWRLLEPRQAWDGNGSHEQLVTMTWQASDACLLVAANYGPTQAQGYVPLDHLRAGPDDLLLVDLLGDARYPRKRGELASRGLYLDLPAWGCHAFSIVAG